jgi:hypothetical protein
LSVHALKDPGLTGKLQGILAAGKPVLMTDGLTERLPGVDLKSGSLTILKVGGNPRGLLELTREQIKPIRDKLLSPFAMKFDAPNKVALYLIGENCLIIENFNDEPINACVEFAKASSARKTLVLPTDGSVDLSASQGKLNLTKLTPRTLVAIEY